MIIKNLTIQYLLIWCLTIRSLTMIQSLTPNTRFFELFIENKNLVKQGLYLLEICQTRLDRRTSRRIVVVTTDRHGLRRPYLCNFFYCSLHYPRRKVWRIITGTTVRRGFTFQNTWTLGIWVLDYFYDLHDERAGWTVMSMTVRHALRNPTLGQTSPSSFNSCDIMPPTDRHGNDEPSQAP